MTTRLGVPGQASSLPSATPNGVSSPAPAVHGPPRRYEDDIESERLALDFFRYTPVFTLILDASLHILEISDSYLDVSDAPGREHVVGLHIDDFLERKVTLPSLGTARKAIRTAQDSARPCELKQHLPDKTAWSTRIVPIFRHGTLQYFQMELQDITAEADKQRDLEDRLYANETYRILVETVKDYAIFMLDVNGNVATWNAGAQRFKGYTREEIVGRHFSNFYGKEDRDNDKPGRELADALRDGRVEDEGWRYRKDGSSFWANVVITPVYKGDMLLGFSKVTRDLTERRTAEVKLIAAYEEASKLKSEFLANMSHEIRTPMHGMLSALTLLLDTALDPEQLELAHVIQEAGGILLQVINDILDYSKLASGCFSISKDIINVPEIIQSIFRAHEKTVKPSITLVSYIDPKLPKAAEGDSLRYRQIVQNLVSNATKFTEEGYVHINARLLEEDDDYYTILTEVIDSGIGVPADLSGSLFTPFMQFDNSATKRYKGTGLGLSICKSLAELMGGKIGFLRNPDDHGSIFWFTARMKKVKKLKVIDALQEELEALAQSTSVSPLEDIRSVAVDKRILLAEDNPINQKVMLKMLTSLGFKNIDLATDGREAVALATKDPPPYHAILMDINMPVLDGVAATKELRDAGIKTPIIAMTANALKGQADLYLAKGMDGYVAKPVDRKLLITILLTWLNPLTPLHDEQELKPAMGGKSVSNESDTASGPQSLTEQVKNVIRNLSPKVAAPEVVYSSQQPTPGSLPPPAPGGHGSSILDTLKAYIIPNNPQEPVSKYDKAPLKPIVASVLEQNETTPGPHLSDAIYSYISSAKFQQSALYSPSFRPKLDSSSKPTTPAPEPSTSETSNTHINPSKPHSPASTDRQSTQQQSAPTTPAVQTLVSEPSTLDGTNAYLVSTTIQEPAPKDETPSEILTTDSLSSPTAPAQEPSTDLKNAYVMPTNIQEAPTTPTPEPSTSDFKNAHIMPAKIQELVSNDQTPPEKPRVDSLSTPTAAPAGTSTADEPVAYITSTTLQEQPLLGGPSLQEHTVDSLPTPMTPAPDSFVVGDMTPRHEATKLQEPVSASVEVLTPPADVPTDSATPFPHYV